MWNNIQQSTILWLKKDTLYIETEKNRIWKFYIGYVLISKVKRKVVFELKAVDDSNIDFVQSYAINGVKKVWLLCRVW